MLVKINIAVAFLAFFALCNDGYFIQTGLRHQFQIKNVQYACPKSSKLVSPKIATSPVHDGLDSRNGYGRKLTKPQFTFTPLSVGLFKILDMVVLPSREVCVLGVKLKNYTLPDNNQFQTMLSIAVWCLPCHSEPTSKKRIHCAEQQLNSIGSDDNKKFKTISERVVKAINEYYYRNVLLFFE